MKRANTKNKNLTAHTGGHIYATGVVGDTSNPKKLEVWTPKYPEKIKIYVYSSKDVKAAYAKGYQKGYRAGRKKGHVEGFNSYG